MKKVRLDQVLVERALYPSREQAQRAVMAGEVRIGEQVAQKPSLLVDPNAMIATAAAPRFVGRGGLKLEGALDFFEIDVRDQIAVDIGASTGGFTDCLLQHAARLVYATDVGTGQLAWTLRRDPRVVVLEQRDIRGLAPGELGGPVDLATVDVAFISLTRVLPAVAGLLSPDGSIVALVKPQFEVEARLARGGVVRDADVHRDALQRVLARAAESGLVPVAATHSPIAGPDGNLEFFVHLRRTGTAAPIDVDAVVAQAHQRVPRRSAPRR